MANAKDLDDSMQIRWLLVGQPGGGKTTSILTLPGKKFVYVFDPNCLSSLKGHDIEYEAFLPDNRDIDLSIKPLKKDARRDRSSVSIEPEAYPAWEEDFEKKCEAKFFDNYDWLCFDGATAFEQIATDRILFLNDRTGKQPEQDDWSVLVNLFTNVARSCTSIKCGILWTCHYDIRQHELSKKVFNQLMLTGKLRTRMPQMFTEVFVCLPNSTAEEIAFEIQTRSDKEFPWVRSSLSGLEMYEDATVRDFSNPTEYGLGRLLKKAATGGNQSSRGTAPKKGK